MKTLLTALCRLNRAWLMALVVLVLGVAEAAADPLPTRFYGPVADQVRSAGYYGGWWVVSARANVVLVPGLPATECVKYRMVTGYTECTFPPPRVVDGNPYYLEDVSYGRETPWLATQSILPTASCNGNALLPKVQQLIRELERGIEEWVGVYSRAQIEFAGNPEVLATLRDGLNVMRQQREALREIERELQDWQRVGRERFDREAGRR